MAGSFFRNGSLIEGFTTTATAAATTTLTASSQTNQQFTGITTQTVVLPNATTLSVGRCFRILNRSTGAVTVKYADGSTTLTTIAAGNSAHVRVATNSTSNGTYDTDTAGAGGSATISGQTNHGVVVASATDAMTSTAAGTAGQPLLSGGASADPAYGTLAIGAGGTGQVTKAAAFDALSPMSAGGDLIYGGASGTGTRLPNGTVNQYLASAGTTVAPAWTSFAVPTIQKFLSTGTTTGWLFTISTSSTVAVGDTYTNNGNTYTVLNALSAQSGQVLYTSGSGTPQATGNLARATGSGTATIAFTARITLATYTTPTSPRTPLYIKIRMVGAGGGGSGSGASGDGGSGNAGQTTAFGTSLLVATGGNGGGNQSGGTGGTGSLGTGPVGFTLSGARGNAGVGESVSTVDPLPGAGANSVFGGGGGAPIGTAAGVIGVTNTGGGGSGGSSSAAVNRTQGSGGGAGGFVEALISSPAATYVYSVGGGGGGGSAGTTGQAGGSGGDGVVIVEEYYQ